MHLLHSDTPIPSRARDELIYARIVDAIVAHKISPGARLPEETLAATFGVSRTIIRTVLHRLALERMVVLHRNRGAQVARPGVEEARHVFAARRMVETASMPDVIRRAGKEQIKALRKITRAERAAQQRQLHSDAIRLSAAFHVELIGIGGNNVITEFAAQLASRSSLIIAVYGSQHSVGCECGEHGELVDLIAAQRMQEATDWVALHLNRIEASLSFEQPENATPDFAAIFNE
ncbi:GntR family transcriptional regulator [Acidihalobacter ferrooxydans]|uniref:GntR family transcriptional regulator n=1 Tax=Acidihalobacter ferrooxydans TaxID=1765967 RepID=A0A1P8UIZ6_9GAMM|nr:GntR family transcriptional regulator [Acidihalobacter ferrooxydans]APZ43751.1 GntR family transcriptional regulator [Acidihalobacter ferrooxydans]